MWLLLKGVEGKLPLPFLHNTRAITTATTNGWCSLKRRHKKKKQPSFVCDNYCFPFFNEYCIFSKKKRSTPDIPLHLLVFSYCNEAENSQDCRAFWLLSFSWSSLSVQDYLQSTFRIRETISFVCLFSILRQLLCLHDSGCNSMQCWLASVKVG